MRKILIKGFYRGKSMSKTTIVCPECQSAYLVEESLLTQPRKFKCSVCNNIWQEAALDSNRLANIKPDDTQSSIESTSGAQSTNTPPQKRNFFRKPISWFMIISIIANIIFWVVYFLEYYKAI